MSTTIGPRLTLVLALTLFAAVVLVAVTRAAPVDALLTQGGAPRVVSYQGHVRMDDSPYDGMGYFKFAIVDAAGRTTFWSNDGSGSGGGEPRDAVPLEVADGLFTVLLGDTALDGMTRALAADVFRRPDRYLRVWFGASDSGAFDQLTPDTRVAAVPYALQAQEAVDADTVDGLHAGELAADYQNVVVVAKRGGDYDAVQAAIDSIADAAPGNPYLVWVAPGIYSETVTLEPYVHLQGAGRALTVISSTIGNVPPDVTQATLVLTHHVSIRNLAVRNGGTEYFQAAVLGRDGTTGARVTDVMVEAKGQGTVNYAIYLEGSSTDVKLENVDALAENGSSNTGLSSTSAVTVRGGSYLARGGTTAEGISCSGNAAFKAEKVTVLAENGSDQNCALFANGVTVTLQGGLFTARGGTDARAIRNINADARLDAQNVAAMAEGGSDENCALRNKNGAAATLLGGSFTGRGGTEACGIHNEGPSTTLEGESVVALAENAASDNRGLYNQDGGEATLRGGSFTGRGGDDAFGIHNDGSSTTLEADSVTATGENGSSGNRGLANWVGADARLRGGIFAADGGVDSHGIANSGSATLQARAAAAVGENGSSQNYGLANYYSAAAADGSQFAGDDGLYQNGGTVRLGVTQVKGGAVRDSGTLTCFQVYDEAYAAYSCP